MKTVLIIIFSIFSFNALSQEAYLLSEINYLNNKTSDRTIKSSMSARIDLSLLKLDANYLNLQLPNYNSVIIQKTKITQHNKSSWSWSGIVNGDVQTSINFAVVGESIHGSLFTPNDVFEISSTGKNKLIINQITPERFDECEGGTDLDHVTKPEAIASALEINKTDNNESGAISTTLDVLIVYSNNTLATLGSHDAVAALAQASIDNMNEALGNSLLTAGINQVRLLDVVAVDRDESGTGNLSTELNWLASDFTVRTLRNELGADMVSMLTDFGGCGLGVVMRNPSEFFSESAFQVTKHSCAVSGLSMAHEFGHNLGLEHDSAHGTSPENASFPYSFGYFQDGQYRTVMSYSSACTVFCPRQMYYSNPDQSYLGLPTGLEDFNDNARTLEQTSLIVAEFREHIENVIFISSFETE